jgi:hypothetical protein
MKRNCTVCLAKDDRLRVEATHVAADELGLAWFECGNHDATDNPGHVERTSLVPIKDWLTANGWPESAFDDDLEQVPPTERNVGPVLEHDS